MKKILFILLFPSILNAVTFETSTIRQDGSGNYTTIALWKAAKTANLVTADKVAVAQIEGVWTSSEALNANIIDMFGWTTSADCYPKICNANPSTGTWDTSKYIITSHSDLSTIRIRTNNCRIEGIQISNTAEGDNPVGLQTADMSGVFDIRVSNCYINHEGKLFEGSGWSRGFNLADGTQTGTMYFYNNIVYNFGVGFRMSYESIVSTVAVYNNTFINCNSIGIQFQSNSGVQKVYIKNNIITSTSTLGTGWSSTLPAGMVVSTQNITYDATSPNIPYRSLRPNFTTVFGAYPNLFLVTTDTCAYQRGQDLRTDPDGICNITTDLAGNIKGNLPSMGALDYQPSAAPTNTIYRYFRSTWFK